MDVLKRPEQFYDVRLIEQLTKRGVISQKDYEKYLKSLNDVEENIETISFEQILASKPKRIRRPEEMSTDMEELESLGSDSMIDFDDDELMDEE